MMNDRKYAIKTRMEEQRDAARRYKQNQKNNDGHKFKSFGFYDFLFFFIVIIISVLCKVLDISFQ
ncbi:hypothetical protein [Epilithonimonas arachidiradicis]|uniref:Uncharacterized protein n=1 Tax=Epilithonimonas arachidiradicis TaxID=1617282 RepID=A0A420CN29_9FLAO|nr:hypothetical protein [Epilithonimonas arachidiradicis]RKE79808.1 hypothetical protein BXY58_3184 [Epilithonimonas arachidiradicis]